MLCWDSTTSSPQLLRKKSYQNSGALTFANRAFVRQGTKVQEKPNADSVWFCETGVHEMAWREGRREGDTDPSADDRWRIRSLQRRYDEDPRRPQNGKEPQETDADPPATEWQRFRSLRQRRNRGLGRIRVRILIHRFVKSS